LLEHGLIRMARYQLIGSAQGQRELFLCQAAARPTLTPVMAPDTLQEFDDCETNS